MSLFGEITQFIDDGARKVYIFCEGEFEGVAHYTRTEAIVFVHGLQRAAHLFSGDLNAYILPEEEADMIEREPATEVTKALSHE